VEVELRRGYLHVVLRGELASPEDVLHLAALVHRVMDRHDTRRLLVDARVLPDLSPEACDAGWSWLAEGVCRQLAWVIPQTGDTSAEEMNVTRINMTGVSSGLPVRGFSAIIDAHRWLDTKPGERKLSSSMPAVRLTDRPPAMPVPGRQTTPPRGSESVDSHSKSAADWHALSVDEVRSTRPRRATLTGKSSGTLPRVAPDERKDPPDRH